jgi:Phage ABA sandwich domain
MRKIDVTVARLVMDQEVTKGIYSDNEEFVTVDGWQSRVPEYSNNIAYAWKVVEKMREKGYFFFIDNQNDDGENYYATFRGNPFDAGDSCFASSAPKAICIAAIKAMGGPEEWI